MNCGAAAQTDRMQVARAFDGDMTSYLNARIQIVCFIFHYRARISLAFVHIYIYIAFNQFSSMRACSPEENRFR